MAPILEAGQAGGRRNHLQCRWGACNAAMPASSLACTANPCAPARVHGMQIARAMDRYWHGEDFIDPSQV